MTATPTPIPIDPADPGKVLDTLPVGSLVAGFGLNATFGDIGAYLYDLSKDGRWVEEERYHRQDDGWTLAQQIKDLPDMTWLAFAAVTR